MSRFETTDAAGFKEQENNTLELYAEFKVTNYGLGIRRIEYSPMLASMEEWRPEKHHYYGVADFFGEDSAAECQKRCISEVFKKQQEARK